MIVKCRELKNTYRYSADIIMLHSLITLKILLNLSINSMMCLKKGYLQKSKKFYIQKSKKMRLW